MPDTLALGIRLREQGRREESRSALLEAAKAFPDDPQVNYQCAWAHDLMGLEKEAIPFYERALAQGLAGKDLEGAFVGLGSSYRCVGEHAKAVELLRRGAEQFPSSRVIPVFLAMALHSRGDSGQAMGILMRELAETSSDAEITLFKRAILQYAEEFRAGNAVSIHAKKPERS